MTTAFDFLMQPISTLIPSSEVLTPTPYPDHMIGGTAPPSMPAQAFVNFTAPNLDHLPDWRSLFNRSRRSLTSG